MSGGRRPCGCWFQPPAVLKPRNDRLGVHAYDHRAAANSLGGQAGLAFGFLSPVPALREVGDTPHPTHAAHRSLTSLTHPPPDREVIALVVSGVPNKQIAGELGISDVTVKIQRGQVMRRDRCRLEYAISVSPDIASRMASA